MRFIVTAQERYSREAERELRETDPAGSVIERFPEGVFLFETGLEAGAFVGRLREKAPVFTRHLQPAEIDSPLPSGEQAPVKVAQACAPLLDKVPPGVRVSVQARHTSGKGGFSDFAVKEGLDPLIAQAGGEPAVKDPGLIVSVFVVRPGGKIQARLARGSLACTVDRVDEDRS